MKAAPKSLDVKGLEFRIKELEDNKKQLLQENRQLNENLVGGRPNSKLEVKFILSENNIDAINLEKFRRRSYH